jgi:hypothetical protein
MTEEELEELDEEEEEEEELIDDKILSKTPITLEANVNIRNDNFSCGGKGFKKGDKFIGIDINFKAHPGISCGGYHGIGIPHTGPETPNEIIDYYIKREKQQLWEQYARPVKTKIKITDERIKQGVLF